MAFDATYLACVLDEIRALEEPRVEKLLFAPNPAAPRLHLTAANPENPPEPPMFCMLLRKHLSGGRLTGVSHLPMERCAVFTFQCIDEMGDSVEKKLVAELMGRTCNLYLLSPEGRIIDCLRRIGLDESAKRAALPGLNYQYPQPVDKLDPAKAELEDYVNLLAVPGADLLAERLMDMLGGLSPLVCREAALAAAGDTECRVSALPPLETAQGLYTFFRQPHKPCYTADAMGTPRQFAFCPINQYGGYREAESFSALLDLYYTVRDRKDALRQKSQTMRKTVQNLVSRLKRKQLIQEKELEATYDRERLRQLGDILTANLHRVEKGRSSVLCEDFYDEEMKTVEIPISPILSPQQNAAKFYKDYTRMKNAERELKKQLSLGAAELSYLESVLEELDRAASDADLEEIRQELQQEGYVKADSGKKRMKTAKQSPMRFESTDGISIFVGRNNLQNGTKGRYLASCPKGTRQPCDHCLRRAESAG